MRNRSSIIIFAIVLAAAAAGISQKAGAAPGKPAGENTKPAAQKGAADAAMGRFSTPGPEHRILEKKVGTWDVEFKYWSEPDAPAALATGVSMFRMLLGGRYLEQSHEGGAQGSSYMGRGIAGYDRLNKKYITLWMDTMSTGFNITEGTCNAEGTVCTETGEVDNVILEEKAKVKLVTTFKDADTFVVELFVSQTNGPAVKTMENTYRRHK
jgi:hypothetical protein